ncbi:hypothetical protein [Burkholderia anthina]|uniref:Uncharacterized protein n=1 Tax=Burkholderia anthina TaxID=179879 RepID=A0A6P2GAH7_9BURK|nr:hypothetical protein [Burkholderia anthina]MBM2770486.1 hypothetical protein [Burkholderia anthina]VVU50742.1 hypothetical protein BAN20980_03462 [Burkholderia anthina]
MTDQEIYNLYLAQSENVRALLKAIDGVVRDINHQIRKGDDFQVSIKTKMLALTYSAWSEAQFVQILYTPNSFSSSEIKKISEEKERQGIARGWRCMLTLASQKIENDEVKKIISQRLTALINLVKIYIEQPATIRNKIAHGQWVRALNSKNTRENARLSSALASLDPVFIEKMVKVHQCLGRIVRDLVQSPKNGFDSWYKKNIENLERYLEDTKDWNLASKTAVLIRKPITRKP